MGNVHRSATASLSLGFRAITLTTTKAAGGGADGAGCRGILLTNGLWPRFVLVLVLGSRRLRVKSSLKSL